MDTLVTPPQLPPPHSKRIVRTVLVLGFLLALVLFGFRLVRQRVPEGQTPPVRTEDSAGADTDTRHNRIVGTVKQITDQTLIVTISVAIDPQPELPVFLTPEVMFYRSAYLDGAEKETHSRSDILAGDTVLVISEGDVSDPAHLTVLEVIEIAQDL